MGQPCTSETQWESRGQDRDVQRGRSRDEGSPADKPPASEGPRRLDLTGSFLPSFQGGSQDQPENKEKEGWRKRTEPQEEGREEAAQANRAAGLGEASL